MKSETETLNFAVKCVEVLTNVLSIQAGALAMGYAGYATDRIQYFPVTRAPWFGMVSQSARFKNIYITRNYNFNKASNFKVIKWFK